MQSYIYVPQGRIARFDQCSQLLGFEGLYTDNFSICAIIAVIGSNGRLSLMHADQFFSEDSLDKERQWVGVDATVVVIHRYEELFPIKMKKEYAIHKITWDMMGVLVRPIVESHDLIPHVQLVPTGHAPDNILRHPDEQHFDTARKIQQLFFPFYEEFPKDIPLVFDGASWLSIDSSEKEVRTAGNAGISEAWRYLCAGRGSERIQPHQRSARRVSQVRFGMHDFSQGDLKEEYEKNEVGFENSSRELGFHIDNYLTGFDPNDAKPFFYEDIKRALEDCVLHASRERTHDYLVMSELNTMLTKKAAPEKFESKRDEIRELPDFQNDTSLYLVKINRELTIACSYYNSRMTYAEQNRSMADARSRVSHCKKYAASEYKNCNYAAAETLYREALLASRYYMTNDNYELSTLCYNLARSLDKQDKLKVAKVFYTLSYENRRRLKGDEHADTKKVADLIQALESRLTGSSLQLA